MSCHNNGAVLDGKVTKRGTSNKNVSGNSTDRRRRREYLVETYRADRDALTVRGVYDLPLGAGVPACRCYRCGVLLTVDTVTVDRIKPGCKGGTYRRENIRPSCGDCASKTGAQLGIEQRSKRDGS